MQGILQNYWPRVNKNLSLMGILLLLICILTPVSVKAQIQVKGLDGIIARAAQLSLAQNPMWLNLLHYKSTLLGVRKSQVDDEAFFLAENGAVDAQAELIADLRGFFSYRKSAHPRCIFPARFYWLDAQLNLSEHLPDIQCAPFNKWKEPLNAKKITLLFPSMHLDSFASMFGHTFIRFDRPANNLLKSKTLSYAASYDETDSVLTYSWKGITGGYPGKFFLRAYSETLQDYSEIEQRDIWEYSLNFNQQEIDQLIRHLWEVKDVHFDYFFFRENCSYRLLALLDVAREGINMSMDAHPLYALPVDTVRDVERAGLINGREYRPATHHAGQRTLAQYTGQSYGQSDAWNDARGDEFNVLPPEQAHATARWNLSFGEREQQRFYQIGLRPAIHDLLDPSKAFIEGASITILETQLRWYEDEKKLILQSLNLFSLESLVPVNTLDTPLSKKISFKIKQRDISQGVQTTEFETQFSLGYTLKLKGVLMYGLATSQLEYATKLESNHALYLGADTGMVFNFGGDVFSGQSHINYQLLQQLSGEVGNIEKFNVGVQFNMADEHGLRLNYEYIDFELFTTDEVKLSYFMYF